MVKLEPVKLSVHVIRSSPAIEFENTDIQRIQIKGKKREYYCDKLYAPDYQGVMDLLNCDLVYQGYNCGLLAAGSGCYSLI